EGRWPVQLAAALRGEGLDVAAPRIIATTGWTTAELDAGIDAAHAQSPIRTDHALVSLLAGVNDQYRGLDTDGFRNRFAALLRRRGQGAGGGAGDPGLGRDPVRLRPGPRPRPGGRADRRLQRDLPRRSRTRRRTLGRYRPDQPPAWRRNGHAGRRRTASVGGH